MAVVAVLDMAVVAACSSGHDSDCNGGRGRRDGGRGGMVAMFSINDNSKND